MDSLFAVLVILGIVAYFIPTIVANARDHRNTAAIFILNLFFGITIVGWLGALIWAVARGSDYVPPTSTSFVPKSEPFRSKYE